MWCHFLVSLSAPKRGPDFWRVLQHDPHSNQTIVTLLFEVPKLKIHRDCRACNGHITNDNKIVCIRAAPPHSRALFLHRWIYSPVPGFEWLCDQGEDRRGVVLQLPVGPGAPDCDCGGVQPSGELHQQHQHDAGDTTKTWVRRDSQRAQGTKVAKSVQGGN